MKTFGSKHLRGTGSFLAVGLLAVVMLVVPLGVVAAERSGSTPVAQKAHSTLGKCRADLAKRLKLQPEEIELADAQTVVWPNAALGMPEIGKVYAEAQVPGERLILEARNVLYLYTASAKAFRYGGPVRTWSYSMLYLQAVESEPNFNSDLYQCSLLGTNSVLLASRVSDYYPQSKGTVIIKRRTSRSGHDLLFINADQPQKEQMLYQAMDFGAASMNGGQDRWAGYVRPGLGTEWIIVVGRVGEDRSKIRTVPLPEGIRPGKIGWSGDSLMILVNKDDREIAYQTNPDDKSPMWKCVAAHYFPGLPSYSLNKSECLEIAQKEEDGKPVVEVSRVWFTGDHNLVAQIPGISMKGHDLLGRYAFIWGDRGGVSEAYTVDIRTGDSVVSQPGTGRNIKPFIYAAHNSPVPSAPKID